MKKDKEIFENLITHVFKKEYPFIDYIEVYKMKEFFGVVDLSMSIVVDIDFIEEHIDKSCYDQMDEIHFQIYAFNMCSDVKINQEKMRSDLLTLYITIMDPKQTIHQVNPDIFIMAEY